MTTRTLVPYPSTVDFLRVDDLELAARTEGVRALVESTRQTYHSVSVAQTMSNLTQVGQLLRLALAGSKGFSCSVPIMRIVADYQGVIKDSRSSCGTFVASTLSALRLHRAALRIAETDPSKALIPLRKCAELAHNMALEAGKLVGKAQQLCDQSRDALVAATKDETITTEQQEAIRQQIAQSQATEASLKQKTTDLASEVEQAKSKERQLEKKADRARKRAFAVSLISTIMAPISQVTSHVLGAASAKGTASAAASASKPLIEAIRNATTDRQIIAQELADLKQKLTAKQSTLSQASNDQKAQLEGEIAMIQAESAAKEKVLKTREDALESIQRRLDNEADADTARMDAIATQRAQLQREQREANASLAETVSRLGSQRVESNRLESAITSLEVVVKTLGKVVTTFQNTRLFWMGVEKHCQALTDESTIEIFAELGLNEDLIEGIKQSGLSWLTLGIINQAALRAIQGVDENYDQTVQNLPTRAEARGLIKTLSDEISLQLRIEERDAN